MFPNGQRLVPGEMRDLLQQMQRTTALLYDRLVNLPAASASSGVQSHCVQAAPPRPNNQPVAGHSVPAEHRNIPVASAQNHQPAQPQPQPQTHRAPQSFLFQGRQDDVQGNLSRLFRPYQGGVGGKKRKRETPWAHFFFCLPEPLATHMPTAEETRYYEQCGLGRKRVCFPHNEGDHAFFCHHLFLAFPPLRGAGGFVLARGNRNKTLEEMPIPSEGYSISHIRTTTSRAPIYVIPIQQSLVMVPSPVDERPQVMERCITCGAQLPLCTLADHIIQCGREEAATEEEEEIDEDHQLALAIQESLQQQVPTHRPVSLQTVIVIDDEAHGAPEDAQMAEGEMHVVEEVAVGPPLCAQNVQVQVQENDGAREPPDLRTLLGELGQGLQFRTPFPAHNIVNVTRDFLLEGAFRAFRRPQFDPLHRINVTFVDDEGQSEGAVDDGGPSREFMRLLLATLRDSRYFEGPEDKKMIAIVPRAVQMGDYRVIGQMLSLALLQGGVRPSFFSPRLCALLCRKPTGPVKLEEVGDWELRQHLERIKMAENLDEARRAVGEASATLISLGCADTLQNIESRHALVEEAARAYVEERTKAALDQLIEGLDCLKVAEGLRAHPDILSPIFVSGHIKLQVEEMLSLFEAVLSVPGSNNRRSENLTMTFWRDWLIEVSGGYRQVSLEAVLIFASGLAEIPPLGFAQTPQLEFLHVPLGNGARRRYPEANTCSVVLRLPLHSTYEEFVEYMESGIIQSPTFGFI